MSLEMARNTEYAVSSERLKTFKAFGLSKKSRSRNFITDG